jgi:hypothetical protein
MKQNLLARLSNSTLIPIAAGILWPLTGTLLNPVVGRRWRLHYRGEQRQPAAAL